MTLFEQLKSIPKLDLHIDFFGSILKETIEKIATKEEENEIISSLELESLKDYENSRNLIANLFDTHDKIKLAMEDLIEEFTNQNMLYAEVFINLDLFNKKLKKKEIINTILDVIKKHDITINLVLELDSKISESDLSNTLDILYEYYQKGINGVYFKKLKLESLDPYIALFDKFIKDKIDYIVLLDSKLTNQNKEIYYNAKRIIYNLQELPDENFLNIIRETKILLEFPITYQNYFNVYDELSNHFVYDLYKENVLTLFTTIDMTLLDTNLLNEYCKLFNVFPFNLHDLINLSMEILSKLNISDEIKNNLIMEFKEKANLLF